ADAGGQARLRRAHGPGKRQVPGRSAGRDRLRPGLHRVVRGRGQAGLRRHHPVARRACRSPGVQGARRPDRGHPASEFPVHDDRPQDRHGAGGRSHHDHQAVRADAVDGLQNARLRAPGRHTSRRLRNGDRQSPGDRRALHRRSAHPQALVHGLDRRGQAAGLGSRQRPEENDAGTGRQRAIHRVRRCRYRNGRRPAGHGQ
ncbi:hypothetical protein OY671_009632, partial [Metschnikowia pulcherrima]